MGKILRLLLFEECNRNCSGCCNKDWDLKSLPICTSFTVYNMILLTGGEPMLKPQLIKSVVKSIRKETVSPIYLYTAKIDSILITMDILYNYVDGMTVTLHDQSDVELFKEFNDILLNTKQGIHLTYGLSIRIAPKSLRLNIFNGIDLSSTNLELWSVKSKIEWIKNCPLPENEVFMRIERSN